MKSKGFTLIELLAVILILGIIALIAIPTVSSVVNTAKENAIINSSINVAKIVEDECNMQLLRGEKLRETYIISNGIADVDLNIKSLPDNGVITVDDKCNATVAITDDKFCITGTIDNMKSTTDLSMCDAKIQVEKGTKESCFVFDNETRTITGYRYDIESCPMDVVIPNEIDGIPVEHIAEEAFYIHQPNETKVYVGFTGYNSFEDPVLENAIKSNDSSEFELGYIYYDLSSAVKYCYNHGNIEFTDYGLDYVIKEDDNFEFCYVSNYKVINSDSITSVNFSKATNLKTIGKNAFAQGSLSSVTFGNNYNLISIGSHAFVNNSIGGEIDLTNTSLTEISAFTFTNNKVQSLKLPNSLKEISKYSFRNNLIEEISFNDGLEKIDNYGFYQNMIQTLTLPSSLKFIGVSGFQKNELLQNVSFPTGVTLDHYSFADTNINSVIIPEGVTLENRIFSNSPLKNIKIDGNITFDEYSFGSTPNALNIDTLTISGKMKNISESAFYGIKIDNLVLEDGIVTIGKSAFSKSSLKTVKWSNTLTTISGGAFGFANLSVIDLPTSLKTIGYSAFSANGATNVILNIPSSVTSIGTQAFYENRFSEVNIYTNKATIISDAFYCSRESKCGYTINVYAAEGTIANAPWGNTYATINYLG